MSNTVDLKAVTREVQGKGASRRLRREGMVPCILYGGGKEPQMIATRHNELVHELEDESFFSRVLTIEIDGTPVKAVLKDLQRHPAKPFVLHADFQRVSEHDAIRMHVPLHFINEDKAPGVKAGGEVSHMLADVEVICEAGSLPEYIEVDLSGMQIGDMLHLSDLKLPEGVELAALSHGEESENMAVVNIHAARGAAAEEGGEEESEAEGE
ncbi:50S ribosomal protein L25/general stress protein Ctc [endosymbiont of unidentified scaly snail isolate Monju]|uniref:50S ribosomal protein L25/general stress protein Ctc n=1 Tax=endosymbiont of unidentified scaly snail isolate Monju TaxID=1248727 RepID=UPI00038929F0|nr:50S ribosomal protein L25/general stress protein Ctc [endosymbiont of unidentified scaly snail isolate Monju]BAN68150.1 large subunit ribosomal protein L25 [endosymbiont of unidentified scaly snail isolate Monju]